MLGCAFLVLLGLLALKVGVVTALSVLLGVVIVVWALWE